MTLPEFIEAIENVHPTIKELSPKSRDEIVSEMAKNISEQQERHGSGHGQS